MITGQIKSLAKDTRTNKGLLMLEVDGDISELVDSLYGKKIAIEMKEDKPKRSKTANNYMWALCREIADAIGISDVEVYRNSIMNVGVYQDFDNLTLQESQTLAYVWGAKGRGWITEPLDYEEDGNHITLRCFFGSSTYDSRQMSHLIDDVEQEAKALGIPTASDEHLNQLLKSWKGIELNGRKN